MNLNRLNLLEPFPLKIHIGTGFMKMFQLKTDVHHGRHHDCYGAF